MVPMKSNYARSSTAAIMLAMAQVAVAQAAPAVSRDSAQKIVNERVASGRSHGLIVGVRSPDGTTYVVYSVAQLYDFLGRYELPRDPGSKYEYSNLAVGLLGHALALRAGTSYEALVRHRILQPLGMTHTAILLTPEMRAHMSEGHDP